MCSPSLRAWFLQAESAMCRHTLVSKNKKKKVYLALVVFLTQTETQMDWGFKWPVGEFHVLTFPEAAPVLGGDLPLDVTKRIGK